MSELVVYGNIVSQPSRSVSFFLKVSNIAHEFKTINPLSGDANSEEFTKINPFQAIPAIVHDGFNLWESPAIIAYLADAYNVDNQWYPKDPKVRGRINAYLHWHHQNIRAPLVGYLGPKYFAQKFRGAPEMTEEEERPHQEAIKVWFENLEWLIAETGYVARTQTATIADVFAYNELTLGLFLPINLDAHPKVRAWFDGIGSDPILQELLAGAIEVIKHITST
jgi:glutathione S-transferase